MRHLLPGQWSSISTLRPVSVSSKIPYALVSVRAFRSVFPPETGPWRIHPKRHCPGLSSYRCFGSNQVGHQDAASESPRSRRTLVEIPATGLRILTAGRGLKVRWSKNTAVKLGWPTFNPLSINENDVIKDGESLPDFAAALAHIDERIQMHPHAGFNAAASALLQCSHLLTGAHRILIRDDHHRVGLYYSPLNKHFMLYYSLFDRSLHLRGMSPSATLNFSCTARSTTMSQDSLSQPCQVTLKDEWKFLRQTIEGVAVSLSENMQFDNQSSATKILAETLLRVLIFRTPSCNVEKVLVRTWFGTKKSNKLKAIATWVARVPESGDEAAVNVTLKHLDEQHDAEFWAMMDEEADNSHGSRQTATATTTGLVVSHDAGGDPLPNSKRLVSSSSSQQTERQTAQSFDFRGLKHLVVTKRSNWIHTGTNNKLIESPEITDLVGAERYGMKITWPLADKARLADLTLPNVVATVKESLSGMPKCDMIGLQHAAQQIQSRLPASPEIFLQFKIRTQFAPCIVAVRSPRRPIRVQFESQHFRSGLDRESQPRALQMSASLELWPIAGSLSNSPATLPEFVRDMDARLHGILDQRFQHHFSTNLPQFAHDCVKAMVVGLEDMSTGFKLQSIDISVSPDHGGVTGPAIPARWQSNLAEPVQPLLPSTSAKQHALSSQRRACIALGSNIGDRLEAIEAACQLIDKDPDLHVVETGSLYETRPMYVEDQEPFLNSVCIVESKLPPMELLDRLQDMEKRLGRVKLIEKGPRSIDLDIITYGQVSMQSERLTIPHALMHEREFVLRPMQDTSMSRWRHPKLAKNIRKLIKRVSPPGAQLSARTPLGPPGKYLHSGPFQKTVIMAILNITPDSFSDGGVHQLSNMERIVGVIKSQIEAGATIIDIGGQSSRPNAPEVTAEEEIERIVPTIQAIRNMPEAQHIAISIDTYRAKVAEAAINAGAHIINDISAGLLDTKMLPTVARLGCTYIMSHMRGTPATMQNEENTLYPQGVLLGVGRELIARVKAALAAGIRRWRIILDPGIGFAKTAEQNAELLATFDFLARSEHPTIRRLPWLVGSSRKGFIGKYTGVEDPTDRMEGTAATVTAAILGGADIVRVHDVKEMARVAKMADAMYKSGHRLKIRQDRVREMLGKAGPSERPESVHNSVQPDLVAQHHEKTAAETASDEDDIVEQNEGEESLEAKDNEKAEGRETSLQGDQDVRETDRPQ